MVNLRPHEQCGPLRESQPPRLWSVEHTGIRFGEFFKIEVSRNTIWQFAIAKVFDWNIYLRLLGSTKGYQCKPQLQKATQK